MSKELEYKLEQSKNMLQMMLVIIVVLCALVGYNYYQLGKYAEITDGLYIEIEYCGQLCDARIAEVTQINKYDTQGKVNITISFEDIYGNNTVLTDS